MMAQEFEVDPYPAAPMGAAGHRRHHLAIYLKEGIAIMVPGPGFRGADRIHNTLFKNLWQRPSEHLHQAQTEPIYTDIIIFPIGARRLQLPLSALPTIVGFDTQLAVMVNDVRLVPQ